MTDTQPLVSILINNYNYGAFLRQSIDSALNQTYSRIEVIVVDDGSQDNSREVINSYGDQIIPVLKPNGGQASALNAGFAKSSGDIICLLDADDIYVPEKVAEVVAAFRKDYNVDWFFHRSIAYKSQRLLNEPLPVLFQDVQHQNPKETPRKIDFRQAIRNAQTPTFAPSTSNICLSRALSQRIFPMPEVPGQSGVAISDLYIKLLAVGLGVGYQTERKLCLFRLHNNIYSDTETVQKRRIGAEISIATGYWLRSKGSGFEKLSNKLFAKGISLRRKCRLTDTNFNDLIEGYLSNTKVFNRIKLNLMVAYYLTKLSYKKMV